MNSLPASHETASATRDTWLEAPAAGFVTSMPGASVDDSAAYSGHLGVLRQEDPNFERQRRYDFWFQRP